MEIIHQCEHMDLAVGESSDVKKVEIHYVDDILTMILTTWTFDSNLGEGEGYVHIPVEFCPFCGKELANVKSLI